MRDGPIAILSVFDQRGETGSALERLEQSVAGAMKCVCIDRARISQRCNQ